MDRDNKNIIRFLLSLPGKLLEGLSNLGNSGERLLSRITRRTGQANEALDRFDSIFGNLSGKLFFPFKVVGSILATAFGGIGQKVADSRLFQLFKPALKIVFYPLIAVANFISSLIRSRNKAALLWSIPMVVLFAAVGVLFWQIQSQRGEMVRNYQKAVEHAIANEAFDKVQLYQQKLQQLGMRTDRLEMQRIQELADSGKWEQAFAEAERISPVDRPGVSEGHYWLVRQYMTGKRPGFTPEKSMERAQIHMQNLKDAVSSRSLLVDGFPPEMIFMETTVLLEMGKVNEALANLRKISENYWPAKLLEMEVNAKIGNRREARQNSLEIADMSVRNPEILEQVPEAFFPLWSGLLAQTGDLNRIRESIRAWYKAFPDNPAAFFEWSKLQLNEIELLVDRGAEPDLARATELLVDIGSRVNPNQRYWLSGWINSKLPPSSNNPRFLTVAKRAAQAPGASSMLLELLGTAAFLRNETSESIDLLKRAIEVDPKNPVALNNTAYILFKNFPSQRKQALEYAEQAVELDPTNNEIRETRGMLLIQDRQWERAIEDLTRALASAPDNREIHAALAEAYVAVGRMEMAGIHQRKAQ
jgi:tetratricopeptide (TPR) repeat protein